MGLLLLAAFIAVPLLEIAVFIEVGDRIGLGATLVLVVVTAILGTWQLRTQGLATLARARVHLDRGVLPADELFDGVCLLFAGALLLTPGFVTDSIGFLLFLAPFRALLRRLARDRIARSARGAGGGHPRGGTTRVWVNGEEVRRPTGPDDIIDGDFQDVTPDDDKDGPGRGSGSVPRSGSGKGPGGRLPR